MTPTSMRALILGNVPKKATLDSSHPVPKVSSGQILVKTAYAATNPPDVFALDPVQSSLFRDDNNTMGSDFAGTVVESQSDAVPSGSRVCGWVPGNVSLIGSYAEYLTTDADLVIKVPDDMALDEASTLGMSLMTSVHALASWLGLPLDPRPAALNGQPSPTPVLVWGGSTACGHFTIQILKRAGYKVITTASRRTTERLKKLGADVVLPREDVDAAVREIQSSFPGIAHALDCFASTESAAACARVLRDRGGHLHTLFPVDTEMPAGVRKTFGLVHTTLGRRLGVLDWLAEKPTTEELQADRALAARWCSFDKGLAYGLLKETRLAPAPIHRWEGGLEGIQGAIDAMREGRVSAGKIVHQIDASEK